MRFMVIKGMIRSGEFMSKEGYVSTVPGLFISNPVKPLTFYTFSSIFVSIYSLQFLEVSTFFTIARSNIFVWQRSTLIKI